MSPPGYPWVSTTNFIPIGPAVWPPIGNIYIYECLVLLYRFTDFSNKRRVFKLFFFFFFRFFYAITLLTMIRLIISLFKLGFWENRVFFYSFSFIFIPLDPDQWISIFLRIRIQEIKMLRIRMQEIKILRSRIQEIKMLRILNTAFRLPSWTQFKALHAPINNVTILSILFLVPA